MDNGHESPEILAAKAHIQFEMDQFADAVATYDRLNELAPKHGGAQIERRHLL